MAHWPMGVRSGGQGSVTPWIFIHGTDKVERALMVLFFGLVCFCCPSPLENISADAIGVTCRMSELHKIFEPFN